MKNTVPKIFLLLLVFGTLAFTNITHKKTDDQQAVRTVLESYRNAIQNLSVDNTDQLFVNNSEIFESGGSEGSYKTYKEHHLGPELNYFKSFTFQDYKTDVKVDLPFAFATESYTYTIVIGANKEKGIQERTIRKKGIATSVLKKIDGTWKIVKYHSSSRNIKPGKH